MILIQHILVKYQNGGFNVIKEHLHQHLNILIYHDGNVHRLYSNQIIQISIISIQIMDEKKKKKNYLLLTYLFSSSHITCDK
jgi:hypothetical protein